MKIRMRDGTGSIDLRYLVEDMDRHGNVRIYVRRPGHRKIRLLDEPGTDAFMVAYRAALAGSRVSVASISTPASPSSLKWLVEHYAASAEFKRLDQDTKRVRKRILDELCMAKGAKPYARMEPRHVRAIRDEKAETPEAANARVKALRRVFAWAVEVGHAQSNPAREVPYFRTGSDGFHTWSRDEVHRFEDRHPIGSKARLAMALLLYTGVRRSDVVRLGRQMEHDGWLRFTEAKGRARRTKVREIPILPELREVLTATPSGHLTYLVTEFGKPYSTAGFGNRFRAWCDAAGLPGCTAHGLRKGGATIAAERGASEHQLMAIYGWESPKQAAIYTRKANRKRLAGDAMHLLVPGHSENESVPLSGPVQASGTMGGKKAC